MLCSKLCSSDLSQMVKQFQGSRSIHAIILVCRDSGDRTTHLHTAVGTTTGVNDSLDSGVNCHCNNYVTPRRHYGRLRQKARMKEVHSQETFGDVSSCTEVKAVQSSMDSRSGLTGFSFLAS